MNSINAKRFISTTASGFFVFLFLAAIALGLVMIISVLEGETLQNDDYMILSGAVLCSGIFGGLIGVAVAITKLAKLKSAILGALVSLAIWPAFILTATILNEYGKEEFQDTDMLIGFGAVSIIYGFIGAITGLASSLAHSKITPEKEHDLVNAPPMPDEFDLKKDT